MIREKKNLTLILLLIHVLEFVFVSGIMYLIYSKPSLNNEALTTMDHARNAELSLTIGLICAIPSFLMWHFYLLPMMMKEKPD